MARTAARSEAAAATAGRPANSRAADRTPRPPGAPRREARGAPPSPTGIPASGTAPPPEWGHSGVGTQMRADSTPRQRVLATTKPAGAAVPQGATAAVAAAAAATASRVRASGDGEDARKRAAHRKHLVGWLAERQPQAGGLSADRQRQMTAALSGWLEQDRPVPSCCGVGAECSATARACV